MLAAGHRGGHHAAPTVEKFFRDSRRGSSHFHWERSSRRPISARASAHRARAAPRSAQHGWRLAQPVTYENLTIFPVVAAQDADTSDFATLDEALASGDAVVTEQGNYLRRSREGASAPNLLRSGAQVNQLVLVNRGKRPADASGRRSRLRRKAGPHHRQGPHRARGRSHRCPSMFSASSTAAGPARSDKFHGRQDDGPSQRARKSCRRRRTRPRSGPPCEVNASDRTSNVELRPERNRCRSALADVTVEPQARSGDFVAQSVARDRLGRANAVISNKSTIVADRAPPSKPSPQEIQRRFDRATSDLKGERVVGVVVAFGGEVAWSDVFASSRAVRFLLAEASCAATWSKR